MNKPNKKNIRMWVEALRSGKYKQGDSVLKMRDAFCCLGVACDISRVGEWHQVEPFEFEEYRTRNGESSALLPYEVSVWLGFTDEDPQIGKTLATELNDSDRLTFAEIADRIERTFLTNKATS
jgi:hypothetical protein